MPANPLEGGKCQPGYYCPGGSDAPVNCTGGYYCAIPGLAAPTAECNQGTLLCYFIFSTIMEQLVRVLLCSKAYTGRREFLKVV